MSAWREVVRELHRHNGKIESGKVLAREGQYTAKQYGLIELTGERGQPKRFWILTSKGRAWAEGRLEFVHNGPTAKAQFRATWLESLPRGLRIQGVVDGFAGAASNSGLLSSFSKDSRSLINPAGHEGKQISGAGSCLACGGNG
jgi:hypothetical protein